MTPIPLAGADPPDFATSRLGFRFRDPETEGGYRRWYVNEAVLFTRLGMVAGATAMIGILVVAVFRGWQTALAPWIFLVMMPVLVVTFVTTLRDKWWRFVLPFTIVANVVTGIVLVWPMMAGVLEEPVGVSICAIVAGFFAFTVLRLHPLPATLAALTYASVAQALLLRFHAGGTVSTDTAVVASAGMWVGLAPGFLASLALERLSRTNYQNGLVIQAQREALQREKEGSEVLLRNALPTPIIDRLKTGVPLIADAHDDVTVLFADLVGFTPLAAKMSPPAVLGVLNQVFTEFDRLAAAAGVEKIKTIGDAYMAVAGAPEPRADHLVAMADLALALQATQLPSPAGEVLRFRVGMATGPVVAGIVGTHKFAYDLWGDTVNVAARMESHGVAGRIQVTGEVARRLRNSYEFESRGLIDIKGKGPTPTYFLTGRAQSQQD